MRGPPWNKKLGVLGDSSIHVCACVYVCVLIFRARLHRYSREKEEKGEVKESKRLKRNKNVEGRKVDEKRTRSNKFGKIKTIFDTISKIASFSAEAECRRISHVFVE